MQSRRKETAPAWLVAIAAAALGLSWGVTRQWSALPVRATADTPRRTIAPLRWPLAELQPLAPARLSLDAPPAYSGVLLGSGVAIAPPSAPALSPPADVLASASAELLAARIVARSVSEPLVVLLPEAPRRCAGDAERWVLSPALRRSWAFGPFDTLAASHAAARWVAGGSTEVGGNGRRLSVWMKPMRQAAAISEVAASPTITAYLARSAAGGAFPLASELGPQLDRVAVDRQLAPWAWAVAYRLRTLASTPVNDLASHRALALLEEAAEEALAQSETHSNLRRATELRRAAYALQRRLPTWRAEQSYTIAHNAAPLGDDPLAGARWAMSPRGLGLAPGVVLSSPEVTETLRLRVARRVEEFEAQPGAPIAQLLADDAALLAQDSDLDARAMAQSIASGYRNANLRIAIAGELIERAMPKPEPATAVVRDRIAGTPVSGRSTTRSQLAVRLIEDAAAWRLGIEAQGVITAQTVSRGGPAKLGSLGSTGFEAKKLVVITPEGLRAAPAVAEVRSQSQRLVSLSTDYDRVPLLGDYVRSTARNEYGRLRGRVQSETRLKVERRVRETFDTEFAPRLAQAQQRYADEVLARAAALGVAVEPIELRTTETRLITRLRVANPSQMAAHTPRMRAPSDSLLSVQVHESMLNNAIEGLDLAGATVTPVELRARLAEKLRITPVGDVPSEQATLRFEAVSPIHFRFAEGRAQLTLAIDEISVRGRTHQDFKVHAFYRPELDGLTAELVQEGTPHIEGRLRNSARMHLHGVMGKVLGDTRRVPLVRVNDQTPERLAAALVGLSTNQFVIEDGWLGIAIGPKRSPLHRVALQVGGYVR